SCDALKKIHNALQKSLPEKRIFSLDVPRRTNEHAVKYLAKELEKLTEILDGLSVDRCEVDAQDTSSSKRKIGLLGSNTPITALERAMDENGFELVHLNHCLSKSYPKKSGFEHLKDSLMDYARFYLKSNTCPRLVDSDYLDDIVNKVADDGIEGLIIQTFKFCDFQAFDYMNLRKKLSSDFPIIMIEHEGFSENEGQIMTRVEAFLEKLGLNKNKTVSKDHQYYVGLDIGSHAAKLVCLNRDGEIIFQGLTDTGTSVQKSSAKLIQEMYSKTGSSDRGNYYMVATGYGRNQIEGADDVITEITCHAKGVFKKLKKGCTVIDIGGQDSKAIRLDDDGKVIRFAMNDKCAAGTGRFLEVIANRLEMNLGDFARAAGEAKGSVPISNMCTVFAESEVISMIAAGHPRENIARGIHDSIAERTAGLVKRIEGAAPFYMAGGVAINQTLVDLIARQLCSSVSIMPDPQLNGAFGAALLGMKS
ncbi:2-hydroxyacyl-CoA dehydratase, partial [bacterium]|nr:2-hydroxyacyl-CoA dehydratase [bacterium]